MGKGTQWNSDKNSRRRHRHLPWWWSPKQPQSWFFCLCSCSSWVLTGNKALSKVTHIESWDLVLRVKFYLGKWLILGRKQKQLPPFSEFWFRIFLCCVWIADSVPKRFNWKSRGPKFFSDFLVIFVTRGVSIGDFPTFFWSAGIFLLGFWDFIVDGNWDQAKKKEKRKNKNILFIRKSQRNLEKLLMSDVFVGERQERSKKSSFVLSPKTQLSLLTILNKFYLFPSSLITSNNLSKPFRLLSSNKLYGQEEEGQVQLIRVKQVWLEYRHKCKQAKIYGVRAWLI